MDLGINVELYLDHESGGLFVAPARAFRSAPLGPAARLGHSDRLQTLCAAAIEACHPTELVSLPETARRAGSVDVRRGRIVLEPGFVRAVSRAWGQPVDRRQLESVALDKDADERRQFRRALITSNVAETARLGPSRHWRL